MTDPSEADDLRSRADDLESLTGSPSSASAALRMSAGYANSVERSDEERAQAAQDLRDLDRTQAATFGARSYV